MRRSIHDVYPRHEVQFDLAANAAIALRLRPIYTMLFEGLHALPITQAVWTRAAHFRAQRNEKVTLRLKNQHKYLTLTK
jgi:hypothetical protein